MLELTCGGKAVNKGKREGRRSSLSQKPMVEEAQQFQGLKGDRDGWSIEKSMAH